jgi:anti-sigma factor RsiW
MTFLRDEILVAYADNQLSDDMRRAVEHVLLVDSEARHTVALFKLSACHVRQSIEGIDFSGVPAWFVALLAPKDARWSRDWVTKSLRTGKWPIIGVAMAACLVLAVAIATEGTIVDRGEGPSQRLAVLGEVPRASVLAEALDHLVLTGVEWTGPDRSRATEIASFRDRFGNQCREVELFSARDSDVPAQVLIACRGRSDRWAVVGAVANEVAGAPVDAHYAISEEAARSSLDSILSLLGAQQRTSAAERKTMTP